MHITKIVIEVIIEFSRDNFAAYDMRDNVVVKRLSTLHTRGIKSCIVGLVVPSGRLIEVNGMVPIEQPKIFASSFVRSISQFRGIRIDFWKFIFSPIDVS